MAAVVFSPAPSARSLAVVSALEAALGRAELTRTAAETVRACLAAPRAALVMDLRGADERGLAEARRVRMELVGTRALVLGDPGQPTPHDADAMLTDPFYLVDVVNWCTRAEQAPLEESRLADLAAGLRHEVGNPLTALSLQIELLRSQDADGTLGPDLDRLESCTRRIDNVIRDFVGAYERQPVEAQPARLATVVGEARDRLGGVAPELVRRLRVECEDGEVLVETPLVSQALADLWHYLLLASERDDALRVRASRPDGVTSLIRSQASAGRLPADAAPRLFTPLWARQALGLPDERGLSLSTARSAFRRHGGELRARGSRIGGITVDGILPTDGVSPPPATAS